MKFFLTSFAVASALEIDGKPIEKHAKRVQKRQVGAPEQVEAVYIDSYPVADTFVVEKDSTKDARNVTGVSKVANVDGGHVGNFVGGGLDQIVDIAMNVEEKRDEQDVKKDKKNWWNQFQATETHPAKDKIFVDEHPSYKNNPFYHETLGRPGNHNRLKFYSGFMDTRNRTQEKMIMKVFKAFDFIYVLCIDCEATERQVKQEQWPFVDKLVLWDGKKNDMRHHNETMLAHRVWWTHVDMWRHAHANGYNRVLILEEDAMFTPFNLGINDVEARDTYKYIKHDEDWHLLRFAYNPHKIGSGLVGQGHCTFDFSNFKVANLKLKSLFCGVVETLLIEVQIVCTFVK